jgi:hypothetical protein
MVFVPELPAGATVEVAKHGALGACVPHCVEMLSIVSQEWASVEWRHHRRLLIDFDGK